MGNAFKYLYRRKDKSAFKQDIEKSIWYLKDASKYPKIIDLSNEDKTIFIKKMAYIISCEEEESVRNIYIKLLDNITYNNLSIFSEVDYNKLIEYANKYEHTF